MKLSAYKAVAVLVLALVANSTRAGTVLFYSGDLRTNANIVACGVSCTLVSGDTDAAWAQWAAYSTSFTLAAPQAVSAITYGYAGGTSATGAVVAAGGLEPYLSLFNSSGNFLESTYFGITCPAGAGSVSGNCYDVKLDAGTLAAGTYSLVLSAYLNMSLAENTGSGTLADGLTGLGNLALNESLNYAFDLNIGGKPASVPEPSTLLLVFGSALMAVITRRRGHLNTAVNPEKERHRE